MSSFAEIFYETATFLKAHGISPEISRRKRAAPAAVKRFQERAGVVLPGTFSAFFTEFADGFEFRWEESGKQWGVFSIPSLAQLCKDRLHWERRVRHFLEDSTQLGGCTDPQFRPQAFEIWRKMKSWVPFWDEGNGDHFCVDTATGQIVYDQHDWFDGFGSIAKTNGILAGQCLTEFLENWSQFCFQPDKRLWWGQFAEFGAIQWRPEYFNAEYYRRS